VPPEPLTRLIDLCERYTMPIVEAQARRLRALLAEGLEKERELARALALLEACGARPSAARVQVELGTLRGDTGLVAEGMATLESLGDLDQLERIAARGS
jgi:hypothetical protein